MGDANGRLRSTESGIVELRTRIEQLKEQVDQAEATFVRFHHQCHDNRAAIHTRLSTAEKELARTMVRMTLLWGLLGSAIGSGVVIGLKLLFKV